MKRIAALLLIAFMPVMAFAATTSIDLAEAIKKDMVKLEAVNITGTYKGKSILLTITNNTKEKLEVKVNLGMILKPINPAFQSLVLAGEEVVTVKSHAKETVEVQTFCGNAPKACPIKELNYSYLRVGSDTLVKVLRYIKDHELYDHMGQSAVWAVTNHHPLSNVYDPKQNAVANGLMAVLTGATGLPKPGVYTVTEMNETPAQNAFSSKIAMIYIPFEVQLSAPGVVSVGLFDMKGRLLRNLLAQKQYMAGNQDIIAALDPGTQEAGKYMVKVMSADKALQEKEVTVRQ